MISLTLHTTYMNYYRLTILAMLVFLVLAATRQQLHAQNDVSVISTPHVEYTLAFPGILPDHPLYKLKLFRDKMKESMVKNPKQKVYFYLLQADKGILGTAMLIDKKEYDLAGVSLLRAEHNMTRITEVLLTFDFKQSPELLPKLQLASLKHQEIISALISRIPANTQKTFETVLEFSKRNQQTIEHYYEVSEDEATLIVKTQPEVVEYLKIVPQGKVDIDHEENGAYVIHVYEVKDNHTATFNWYTIDKATGSVKKEF